METRYLSSNRLNAMNRIRTAAFISLIAGVTAIAWLPVSAWGQAAGDQAEPTIGQVASQQAQNGQSSSEEGALQEVVVTAERRTTNILTTPISIDVSNGAQLASENFTHLQSLQLSTPSLMFNNDGLYQAPSIRGLGTAFSPSLPLGVALIEDGLFIPDQNGFADPFYDMADVETLRGPQGTFVGFSSTAGAIEMNSANPNFRGFNGYAEAYVGNYSDKRIDDAFNFVLIPNVLAVRLATNWEQEGSFYRDNGSLVIRGPAMPIQDPGATDDKDARFSALWKPTDSFEALLKLQYTSDNTGGTPANVNQSSFILPKGAPNTCPTGAPGPTCYTTYYPYSAHEPYVLDYTTENGLLPPLGMPYVNYRDTLRLDYTFADGTDLRSVSGFSQLQYDTLSPGCGCDASNSGASYQWIPTQNYFEEEMNLISPTTGPFFGKFNYIAGATWFYKNTGVTSTSVNEFPPYSVALPSYSFSNTDTLYRLGGLFGQISWQILPSLQLQVGARENWDNTVIRGTINQSEVPRLSSTTKSQGCFETQAPAFGYVCSTPNMRGQNTDNVPTGKIDLNWTPVRGQFFYVFYARGYKGEGVNAEGTEQHPLPSNDILPEYVNDWEIGWNGSLLNNHLTTHLGGYWMVDKNSQQAGIFNPLTGGTYVGNLGSLTLKGIEATLNGRLGGFGVNFDASYEKTALSGITLPATYALPPGTGGLGQCGYPGVNPLACFNYNPYLVGVSGEVDPHAPELQGSLAFDYAFRVGQGTLDPKITYFYTAKQYANLFQIPFYEMGSRHIWNAALNYDVGQWEVEAYDNNFTNETYLTGIMGSQVFYGAPQQFGVRVRKDF